MSPDQSSTFILWLPLRIHWVSGRMVLAPNTNGDYQDTGYSRWLSCPTDSSGIIRHLWPSSDGNSVEYRPRAAEYRQQFSRAAVLAAEGCNSTDLTSRVVIRRPFVVQSLSSFPLGGIFHAYFGNH